MMRPKSLLLLMLALGCGLVASIGINQVLANRRAPEAAPSETTDVFVVLSDINTGDPITPAVVKLEAWPKDKVPPGALTKLEQLEGRRSRTKLFAGEPIIEGKLRSGEASSPTDDIPAGMRVVAVKVDNVISGRLLQVGDFVDVLVHLKANRAIGIPITSTRTFLNKIKIFAVDREWELEEKEGGAPADAKTISLLVTPQQAELVTLATELGDIRLVMRSATDDLKNETVGVTPDELLRGLVGSNAPASSGPGIAASLLEMMQKHQAAPPAEPQDVAIVAVAPRTNTWKMVIYRAAIPEEVRFVDGEPVRVPKDDAGPSLRSSPSPGPLPADETPAVPAPYDEQVKEFDLPRS